MTRGRAQLRAGLLWLLLPVVVVEVEGVLGCQDVCLRTLLALLMLLQRLLATAGCGVCRWPDRHMEP